MENDHDPLSLLTNEQLLARVKTLAQGERDATASLLASLAELDSRKAYLGEGYPSLFAYCTQALHFSEDAAYNRMKAARAARKWPVIFEMIADGSVTLTSVRLLADSLTDANHQQVLEAARHRSKREVEQMIASLHPQPAVPSTVRRLPAPKDLVPAASADRTPPTRAKQFALNPAPTEADRSPAGLPPCRPAVVAPLAPERYKVQITISRETHDKLRRVQDLLRHQLPDGDPAVVFDRALTLLLQDLERKKLAATSHPRPARATTPGSRHVPAAIRREVWKRDGGQCAFVGTTERCAERGFLEFHHVVPFADGGPSTADNLQLRCRAHNLYEAQEHLAPLFVREAPGTFNSFPAGTRCDLRARERIRLDQGPCPEAVRHTDRVLSGHPDRPIAAAGGPSRVFAAQGRAILGAAVHLRYASRDTDS